MRFQKEVSRIEIVDWTDSWVSKFKINSVTPIRQGEKVPPIPYSYYNEQIRKTPVHLKLLKPPKLQNHPKHPKHLSLASPSLTQVL